MPSVVGMVVAGGVAWFARAAGFDRDRAFYPAVTIVVASYYVLFAAMSGSVHAVLAESIPMVVFATAAGAGFRSSTWIVVGALAGHGVFDPLRGEFLANSAVPAWWPAFCLAYDLGAAAILAWSVSRHSPTRQVLAQ